MEIKKVFPTAVVFIIAIQSIFIGSLFCQDTIYLKNPSFEDMPHRGGEISSQKIPDLRKPSSENIPNEAKLKYLPIKYWYDCGILDFPEETPPDIHPVLLAAWGVNMDPKEGKTFLGLVVRYNNTYEAISQKLRQKLKKNKCYTLSGYLARSDTYQSHTRRSLPGGQPENFNNPAQLRIWAGSKVWPKKELLVSSGPVSNIEWQLYEFTFSPSRNYTFFTLEAYYIADDVEKYNGNVLVDRLSPITQVKCK